MHIRASRSSFWATLAVAPKDVSGFGAGRSGIASLLQHGEGNFRPAIGRQAAAMLAPRTSQPDVVDRATAGIRGQFTSSYGMYSWDGRMHFLQSAGLARAAIAGFGGSWRFAFRR